MSTSLTYRGYGIVKERFTPEQLDLVRQTLTITPFLGHIESNPFKVYSESSKKLYVPKAFGLQEFGLPEEDKLYNGDDIEVPFVGSLRPEQLQPVDAFLKAANDPTRCGGIINLVCGQGKCLAKGTEIITSKGDVTKVETVVPGDFLMGDDGYPRRVVSCCRGREMMYKIRSLTCPLTSYTVNKSHILSLWNTDTQQAVDLALTTYLQLPEDKKQKLLGYKADVLAVGHTFHDDTAYEWGKDNMNLNLIRNGPLSNRLSFLRGYVETHGLDYNTFPKEIVYIIHSCGLRCDTLERDTHYPIAVEQIGCDEYFGFELEGTNRRFVLANFTVTHNTVCALNIIAQLKKKTLIVVHKDFLLNQWRERIQQFLPSASVGLIKAKVTDVEDKDIVIGSLQSLSMKDYDLAAFDGFGLMVVDECHRTGAEVFSKVYKKINTRYTLGLSATVTRKDGMSKVFKWHLGDIVYKGGQRKDTVNIDVKTFYDPCPSYSAEVLLYNGKANVSRMINNICDFKPRLEYISTCIIDVLQREPQRKVLVLSDRRKHLEDMRAALAGSVTTGFYYGGMKPDDLKESETKQVLLATFAFCAEGLDVAQLDTLVLASPKSDIIQSVGRILREKECNRVNTPLVIDIVDDFSIFRAQAAKRRKYYKSQKYNFLD